MKILCMSYEYPPVGGGGASVAHPLAAGLASSGHTIDVVTSGMGGLLARETIDHVNIHRVRCLRRYRHYTTTLELSTYLWPAFRKARELCRTQHFDINHTHFAIPSGVVSYLLYKRTGLPYVVTIHGSDVPGYNLDRFRLTHMLVRPGWRTIIQNASRVVSASIFLKDLIQSRIDVPVDIVPNGFEPPDDEGHAPGKENRILVVTRIFRRKGVQHFLDALTGLDHDWEVVVAGDGPYLNTLKDQVSRLNLNVKFTGFVRGRDLLDLYRTSKLFVFPSLQENFPVVLLEAMHSGCAIITTSAEGCGEVIGDAGIVTTPERPDEIRAALVDLMQDEHKIEQLGASARIRVREFGWPRISERYERILQQEIDYAGESAAC